MIQGREWDNYFLLGHFLLCSPVHLEDVHGGWEDEVPDGGHEGADHGRGEGGGAAQDADARLPEGSRQQRQVRLHLLPSRGGQLRQRDPAGYIYIYNIYSISISIYIL